MKHLVCAVLLVPVLLRSAEAGTLTGQVVDANSGKPIAARIYLQSADGGWRHVKSADTQGSAVEYNVKRGADSIEVHTSVSAHPFKAELPNGTYRLTIERGKEYTPKTVDVKIADADTQIEVSLKRWTAMAERGWYSGDTHVHRTIDDLPTAMLADDLNVALPLTYWVTQSHTPPSTGNKINSGAKSDGKQNANLIEVDKTHVIWPINTEYEIFSVKGKQHTLGAVFALNHTQPFDIGIPRVDKVAAAARKQDALLDLDKHSWPWSLMIVPQMDVDLFELTNNHVWRTEFLFKNWTLSSAPESFEIERSDAGFTERGWVDFGFKTYYALLNCGFNLRPTAGTASGVHPVGLGFGRVYVKVNGEFSYDKWIAGLDAGNSFVTTGPMTLLKFNGHVPGHKFDSGDECVVTGIVESLTSDIRLQIVSNGDVVTELKPKMNAKPAGGYFAPISVQVPIQGSSWVAVRCFEERKNGRFRFAHTAPVHFEISGKPLRPRKVETNYLIQRMKEELERNKNVLSDDELNEYRKALGKYQRLSETAR